MKWWDWMPCCSFFWMLIFFLETHWTHFYWAPTMYTRHWPRCWWYKYSRRENRQKPHPLQSSWSLHSCEIKARKLIRREKDKLWAKDQFLWRVTKWIPIVEVRRNNEVPTGWPKNTGPCWAPCPKPEKERAHSLPCAASKGGGQCAVLPRRATRPVKSLPPNQRQAMVV